MQLYVTGLTLGENTTLCLADLICGITSDVFDNKTTYDDMIAKYDTVTAGYGRIFRKSNFDLICKKAQEKGSDRMTMIHVMFFMNFRISQKMWCGKSKHCLLSSKYTNFWDRTSNKGLFNCYMHDDMNIKRMHAWILQQGLSQLRNELCSNKMPILWSRLTMQVEWLET